MLEAFDALNLNYFVMEIICDGNGVPVDGIYREVSPATVKLIGKSQEDIIGKSRRELFGNVNDEFPAKFFEVLKTGQPAHFQSHGAALQMYYDVYAWKIADKQVAAIVSDITEHKKTEEDLRKSESQKNNYLESMTDGFVAFDKEGKYTYVNTNAAKILHKSKEELIGKIGIEAFPNAAKFLAQFQKAVSTGRTVHFEEHYSEPLNIWYECHCYPSAEGLSVFFSDINERKRAEEALKDSEERFRGIFEKAAFGVAIADIKGHIIECNPALQLMLGYTKEELYGKSFADITNPDDLSAEQAQAKKMHQDKSSYFEVEKRYIRKNGELVWAHLGVSEVASPNQNKMVIAVVEDITKRKKTEEESQKNSRKLELLASLTSRLLSHSNPQGLVQEICQDVMNFLECDVFFNFLIDAQKGKLHLNAYSGVTQKTADTIEWLSLGEAVCGCAAQYDKQTVCENIQNTDDPRAALVRSFGVQAYAANPIYADEKVIGTLSFGTKKKPFFTEDELSLIRTVASQVSVAMQRRISIDKMEQLVMERTEKLELSANYARELIETSLDPLVTISSEGKITDVNRATEIVTGCCREELIGSDFSDYFTEPKKAEAGYKKVLAEGYVRDYPLAIKSRTGETTEVLYNAAIYYDKAGKPQGLFAAARDITERKKLEKQLHEKDRLAAIGATAGMVGHDIRNPLQSIIGEVFLAKAELEGLPDSRAKKEIQESLNHTESSIEYINKIVQDLQDYARPLNPKAEDADLQQVFTHVVTQSKVPQNITTHIEVDPEAQSIKTDTYYLNRILYNLITNSVQAMTNGGELTIRAQKEGKDTVIAVSDTGAGIPIDVQPKMFTVMFTTKSKGQGFGLPVVKRMTESLGGVVSFESIEGKGTTFTLKLPDKA
jgi:PAS domain S-box-containing protein